MKGWTPEALALQEKAIGLNPWGGHNHNSLGCEFFEMGSWARAAAELERAVEINPWQPLFKANLARAYLALGNALRARETAADALKTSPGLPQALFAAGLIEEKLENAHAAVDFYRRCLSAGPSVILRRETEENLHHLAEAQKENHEP